MSVISLEGMHFYAHHGCFEAEQSIGTHFCVDLSFVLDTQRAQLSDNLEDTVNYQDVYKVVSREFMKPSHLLEHVADRVAESLLDDFPLIQSVSVKVSKLAPPLGGQIGATSVLIEKLRKC